MDHLTPYEPPALELLGKLDDLTGQDQVGSVPAESDRALKDGLEPVDPDSVLAGVAKLDVSRWSYLWDEPKVRHIGPMAQDFAATFEVGEDNRRIHPVDMNGVALAAIKALKAQVDSQAAQIAELKAELEDQGR